MNDRDDFFTPCLSCVMLRACGENGECLEPRDTPSPPLKADLPHGGEPWLTSALFPVGGHG